MSTYVPAPQNTYTRERLSGKLVDSGYLRYLIRYDDSTSLYLWARSDDEALAGARSLHTGGKPRSLKSYSLYECDEVSLWDYVPDLGR